MSIHAVLVLALFAQAEPPASRPVPESQPAHSVQTGFSYHAITLPDKTERKYALFVPPDYPNEPGRRWPVILFLHGSGERGVDGIRHTQIGLPAYVKARQDRFPFIVVMPQAKEMWFRGVEAFAVATALDEVMNGYRTDPERVSLTGLSMGGFAAWEMAMARPDIFAAIVPVCGVGDSDHAANIRDLPIWAFHGAKDNFVPVAGSRRPIEALRKIGALPKYTEYADEGHFIWDRAYATKGLYDWMITRRRKPAPRVVDYRPLGTAGRAWWVAVAAQRSSTAVAHVRAEAGENGRVTVTTEGVEALAILPDVGPIKRGDEIEITWNGREVFKGKCEGELKFRQDTPTTRPGR